METGKVSGYLPADATSYRFYEQGFWAPCNPEGKKQYGRDLLMSLGAMPQSRRPLSLPDFPELLENASGPLPAEEPRTRLPPNQQAEASGPSPAGRPAHAPSPSPPAEPRRRIVLPPRRQVELHKTCNAYRPKIHPARGSSPSGDQDSVILRKFKCILNKVTPEKFGKLANEAQYLAIESERQQENIADLVFEKALSEPKFAAVYAQFCRKLSSTLTAFRGAVLRKCQKEFQKEISFDSELNSRLADLESEGERISEETMAHLRQEAEVSVKKAQTRSLGNIRFTGELFRAGLLKVKTMHHCIVVLLGRRNEHSVVSLAKLLDTCGRELDRPEAKTEMDEYCAVLEMMVTDKEQPTQQESLELPHAAIGSCILSTRVKFGVRDVLDLRRNGWLKRAIDRQNKPTLLKNLHCEAKNQPHETPVRGNHDHHDHHLHYHGGARPKAPRTLSHCQPSQPRRPVKLSKPPHASYGTREDPREERPHCAEQERRNSQPLDPSLVAGRLHTITEELVQNNNFQETLEGLQEVTSVVDHSVMVRTMMEIIMEKASYARQQCGRFFSFLSRRKQVTNDSLIKGLTDFIEGAEDLEPDLPKIWDYLAEVLSAMMTDTPSPLPPTFLKLCLLPLVNQGRRKQDVLRTKVLQYMDNSPRPRR